MKIEISWGHINKTLNKKRVYHEGSQCPAAIVRRNKDPNALFGLIIGNQRMLECAPQAQVAKLVDAPDLGSGAERCGGSSPFLGTKKTV